MFIGSPLRTVTAALVFVATLGGAQAAPIIFAGPTAIGTGVASLSQAGVVEQAIDYGVFAGSISVAGINFTASTAASITEPEFFVSSGASTNLDPNFNAVLGSFAFNSPPGSNVLTINLAGLTAGNLYSVQIFAVDERAAVPQRDTTFSSVGGNSQTITVGTGFTANYIIGTFIADPGGTQTITATGNAPGGPPNIPYINALVLRNLTAVAGAPELNGAATIPLAFVAMGLMCLLSRPSRIA